jgi:hypothetical protein
VLRTPAAAATPARTQATGGAAKILTKGPLALQRWDANSSNTPLVTGRVLLRGRPVAHARVMVAGYILPTLTRQDGSFGYPVDITLARRRIVRVIGLSSARVGGRPLTKAERGEVLAARGAITVAFPVSELKARTQKNGSVLVTGRVSFAGGAAAPPVVLYTYQLQGTITDADGKPVPDAVVVTRTLERDFWTMSAPSNAQGRYVSFFTAADTVGSDPVPMSFQVAVGNTSYATPAVGNPTFKRLRSATMDIKLPARGTTLAVPQPTAQVGGIYEGMLVGVSAGGRVIKPTSARWPDRNGRFSLVLPPPARGKTLGLWQNQRTFYSRNDARPGGPVDLAAWPNGLTQRVPQAIASVRAPR